MSTPFDIIGVVANAGDKVVTRLVFPTGLVTGAATTITGGTAGGGTVAQNVAAGQNEIFLGLIAGADPTVFKASSTIAGTVLPNTTNRPYTTETRHVDDATDMTTHAGLKAGWYASTDEIATGLSEVMAGGFLLNGNWTTNVNVSTVNGLASDTIFSGTSLAGSTATVVLLDEAHDAAKGATYIGNTAVWSGVTAPVLAYGPDPGSGASVVTVGAGFDSPPQAGDAFKIVRAGTGAAQPDLRGAGADHVTLNWTNSTTSLPVADGDVWVTSDAGGNDVVAGTLQTDSAGNATFLLDAGLTYYFWGEKDGVNPIKGQQFVAVAD